MSGSIKEVFKRFTEKRLTTIDVSDTKRTTIRLPVPLFEAVNKYCAEKKIKRRALIKLIEGARPKELSRTEAIRIVFFQIYFNPEGLEIHD